MTELKTFAAKPDGPPDGQCQTGTVETQSLDLSTTGLSAFGESDIFVELFPPYCHIAQADSLYPLNKHIFSRINLYVYI